MNIKNCFVLNGLLLIAMSSCTKSSTDDAPIDTSGPKINFVFKFDSTQVRLDALGNPTGVKPGNDAQSPVFNFMSAHYVEMTPNEFTAIGGGAVLYKAPETTAGGVNAIDFDKSTFAHDGETFVSVPVKSFAAGTYNWLRVSLAYQNYNIKFKSGGQMYTGTLASFIGFRSYVTKYKIRDSSVNVNANKDQGYWGFETPVPGFGSFISTGQAPAGATTVPNPLFASSPIPAGSCLVTGKFATPLVVTGTETSDITIVVSLSTNKSFEWKEVSGPGTFDPANGDYAVDMGIRGLIPYKL